MPRPAETDSPATSAPPREPWGWTRSQRIALGTLSGILVFLLLINYWRRPDRLGSPTITHTELPALPQKMNPNTASAAALARIPHIGETLATRITDYRAARQSTATDGIVFRALTDLDNIPGIGKKLLEQLEPFLEFPAARADDDK